MSDTEAAKGRIEELKLGYELALSYARAVASLPVDIWLAELEHAEAVAPIVDPTLFREYLYSAKPQILKKILRSLLEVKRAVEEAQPEIRKQVETGKLLGRMQLNSNGGNNRS
jgi:hypothetical protein